MNSFALIIFGITGNLAQKYLIPALYDMAEKNNLPKDMTIVGTARRPLDKEVFKKYVLEVVKGKNLHHKHPIDEKVLSSLLDRMSYLQGSLEDPGFYLQLKDFLEKSPKTCSNRIYYLATYPELYHHVFENLQRNGMNKQDKCWVRIMVEKPIGHDLQSAKELNHLLLNYFSEDQIYRLDHYLAKETLQNILTFRFSNGIFEPLISNDFIDHIQISATEDFGIGKRGGYYDNVGALKDVGQNHLLQMLAFAAMDAPEKFSNEAITSQRIKILRSLLPDPKNIVFGQYKGYRDEENINPNSQTETFFALKTYIDSERFKNVPIYMRAGKKLKQTVTEISIVFKTPINRLLKHLALGNEPNVLIYRIQPNEGIVLRILTKVPGETKLAPEYMQFCYRNPIHSHYFPDPYERILTDTMNGDQTFFSDAKEVEAQWAFIDPLVASKNKPFSYSEGSWGPKEADELIKKDGRAWLEPSMDFCQL